MDAKYKSNPAVKAEIRWLRPEEGGRHRPPTGPTYSTVSHFAIDKEYWPEEAWSIVAEFCTKVDEHTYTNTVILRFLAENAPHKFLFPGSKFKLLEGPKVVAEGEILRESITDDRLLQNN